MKRSLLSILYICCITTLCCAAEKVNLKEMYAQLDKAISNAPYYKQQKETHINQQKLALAKVRNNQQQLKKANVRLTYTIVCVSLLVIFLAFSVYYINKLVNIIIVPNCAMEPLATEMNLRNRSRNSVFSTENPI